MSTQRRIVACLLVLALLAGCYQSTSDSDPPTTPLEGQGTGQPSKADSSTGQGQTAPIRWQTSGDRLTGDEVGRAIERSTDYLVAACDDQGKFVYRRHLDSSDRAQGQTKREQYNVLRHAGAVYALCRIQRRSPTQPVADAIRRSSTFLVEQCVDRVGDEPNQLAVWSVPQLTGFHPRQAKLGGTGLGLVALVEAEDLLPGSVSRETLLQLGEFLLAMQRSDGGFETTYLPDKGPSSDWVSLYYPGEAALGLVLLYERTDDIRWLNAAAAALRFLVKQGQQMSEPLEDHWMMIAAQRIWPYRERASTEWDVGELQAHVLRTGQRFVGQQRRQQKHAVLRGCFNDDGRTTPSATRLEGLLAAVRGLQFGPAETKEFDACIDGGMRFLAGAQVRQGPYAGAFPMAVRRLPLYDKRHEKFNPLVREVRIDYVQHAVCALIEYEAYRWPPDD